MRTNFVEAKIVKGGKGEGEDEGGDTFVFGHLRMVLWDDLLAVRHGNEKRREEKSR